MAENEILRFDPQAVHIDDRHVLRLIGYPPGAAVADAITDALPQVIRAVRNQAEPAAVYTVHAVQSVTREAVSLVNGVVFRGERLARAMRAARQAVIFVLTLGQQRTGAAGASVGKDPFDSFLFDSVGSIMVEAVADDFQALLEGRMNQQGAWGGFRFSPGYCDWPIEANRSLFQMIDASSIGVQLTAGGMMLPQKSISGVIGFGVTPEKIRVNPCTGCPRTECDHRRDA